MVEEFNRKIGKAMTKLETLTQVNLISIRTSSYSFGKNEPYAKDRYNLDLELDSNLTLKSKATTNEFTTLYLIYIKKKR